MNSKKTGQFIQSLRKELGITQKELAEKLGCTDKAVSRWETGAGLPDVGILLDLSSALGVSVSEILRGEKLVVETTPEISNTEASVTEEIITATDETVLEVLRDTEKKIKQKNRYSVIFCTLCVLQLLVIFVLPNIISAFYPTAEPVIFILYPTIVFCITDGLLPDRIKWLYPLFLSIAFFAPIPFSGNESHVYRALGIYGLVISLCVVTICHGISVLIRRIKAKK